MAAGTGVLVVEKQGGFDFERDAARLELHPHGCLVGTLEEPST
jgi:hypothetical protein